MGNNHSRFRLGTALASVLVASAVSTQAATLRIEFNGLDFKYDAAGNLYDATSIAGGTGNGANADPLAIVQFFTGSTLLGTVSANIYADFLFQQVNNIPVTGGAVTSSDLTTGFGFDILTQPGTPGWGVDLEVSQVVVNYDPSSTRPVGVTAIALADSLFYQNLPSFLGGMQFDPTQPINITFSASDLTSVTSAGGFLTGFSASGNGNVVGTISGIPEPSEYLMAGLGLLGLGYFIRRKKAALA